MSYILACNPPAKPLYAIRPEGNEEYAEENPWVHMQFDKAEQYDQAPQQEAEAKKEPQLDPTKVLEAFAAARGELDILLALIARLKEGNYLTVGRVERPDDTRVRDLARDKISRVGRRTASLAAAAQSLQEGADALAAAGRREDAFYADVAKLQQYWKLRPEPPSSVYAFSIDLDILPSSRSSSSSSSSSHLQAAATPSKVPPSTSVAGGAGGSGAPPAVLTRVGLLKDPSGTVRVQLPTRRSQAVPSVMVKEVADPPTSYIGPAAVHKFLLSQLQQQLWAVASRMLSTEVEAALGYLPALPTDLQLPAATGTTAADAVGADPPVQTPGAAASGGAAAGKDGAAAAAGNGSLARPPPGSAAGDPRQRLFAMLSVLVLQRVSGKAAAGNQAAPVRGTSLAQPSRDPTIAALRPLVLQYVVNQELQHLQLSASAAVGVSQTLGAAGGGSSSSSRQRSSLMPALIRRLTHAGMRDLVRQVVHQALLDHPGVLLRTLGTTRSCCSAFQLLPTAAVAAGQPAPGVLLLIQERDILVESGLGTGADPSWLKDRQRHVKQVHQLRQVLDQLLPQLQCIGQ